MTLQALHLGFAYRHRRVIDDISLSLDHGEVVSLLGANGAGKSTLLKLLLGLQASQEGQVTLNGRSLTQWRRRQLARELAYVPQVHITPFPYSVREIVTMGRTPAMGLFGARTQTDTAAVALSLRQLGIEHLADRPYTEVSGGERQLTLIARALAQGARLLILDEPTNGLDYGHQLKLLARLRELATDGYGVLMTTHHPDHARLASDRVLLLRDGRLRASGHPDQVVTPSQLMQLYDIPESLLERARRSWIPAAQGLPSATSGLPALEPAEKLATRGPR